MKFILSYAAALIKNPWFYFCLFMAVMALWERMPLVALMFGIVFPITGAFVAYCEGKYRESPR